MKSRACELCKSEAALFCPSDSAFLCWNCDSKVHGANFLVARHVRRTICFNCNGFSGNIRVSGVGIETLSQICGSCSPGIPGVDLDSLSSSSACISSTESCAKEIDFDRLKADGIVSSSAISELSVENSNIPVKLSGEFTSTKAMNHDRRPKSLRSRAPAKMDSKAEGILVNWSRKLGLDTVAVASRAFGVCLNELTDLPFRVSLAASLWFSFIRLCSDRSSSTWQILKRLEEISGVPAKLILVAESRLARVLKMRRSRRRQQQQEEEEGWAETESYKS